MPNESEQYEWDKRTPEQIVRELCRQSLKLCMVSKNDHPIQVGETLAALKAAAELCGKQLDPNLTGETR